jgi:hypothetical protein
MMRRVAGELPYIDEHAIEVAASPERAWRAVGESMGGDASSPVVRAGVRVLGCRDTEARGDALEAGSTFPGWRVAEAAPPDRLVYEGRHRFSNYMLTYRIDPLGPSRARVRAETRAAFPGAVGSAYRAMVIGTRFHVIALRRLLGAIRRRAEAGS